MRNKLKALLASWPPFEVFTSQRLTKLGYSPALVQAYKKSGWLHSLGDGAYYRAIDGRPTIEAGIAALRKQLGLKLHVGGRSALEFYGASNQGYFAQVSFIYGAPRVRLPKWFREFDWKVKFLFYTTNLFAGDEELGVTWVTDRRYSPVEFPCSTHERAVLERFLIARDEQSFDLPEKDLLLSYGNLDPALLQHLLERCTSIRVKRVFLYAASLYNYDWATLLDRSKIDLGTGPRQLFKGGVYDHRFMLTVERKIPFEEIL